MKRKQMIKMLSLICIGSLMMVGCSEAEKKVEDKKEPVLDNVVELETIEDEEALAEIKVLEVRQSGKVFDNIPVDVIETMKGKSIPNERVLNDVLIDNTLVYLPYINFEGEPSTGMMVVNKKIAKEVLEIFTEIYDNGIPIEKIGLVDEYDASDERSMVANNSSAFNYRVIAGTNKLSNHGKGLAIDINPLMNPHVIRGVANPKEGQKYSDRTLGEKGMITKDDIIHKAFTSRGWEWGGDWTNPDYQHFEKSID